MKHWIMAGVVLGVCSAAHADFTKGSQTIAIQGGLGGSGTMYDYQPGAKEPVTGSGGAFGAQYMYYFKDNPALGIGADFMASQNGDRSDNDLLANYRTTARLKSKIGLVMLRLAYPHGFFRPYLLGGLGVHHSKQTLTAFPITGTWPGGGTETRMLIDEDKTSIALAGGIGFDFFPTESFFIGTEIRGTLLGGLDTDDNAALNNAGFVDDSKKGISQGNILFHTGIKF